MNSYMPGGYALLQKAKIGFWMMHVFVILFINAHS